MLIHNSPYVEQAVCHSRESGNPEQSELDTRLRGNDDA
jgi:hypothetical protein